MYGWLAQVIKIMLSSIHIESHPLVFVHQPYRKKKIPLPDLVHSTLLKGRGNGNVQIGMKTSL
jgi:hypothetical protein